MEISFAFINFFPKNSFFFNKKGLTLKLTVLPQADAKGS
jgi:hypothetical protein